MTNIRSTNVIGLGSMKFQRAGQRWQPCHEAMISDCPPEPVSQTPDPSCDKLDVMFVFPEGTGGIYYPSQFANTLEDFADYIAANTTDYQLGCVVAQDSGAVSVIESLSLNNVSTFKSSLSSLSTQTYSLAKNIDGAMETAVDGTAGTWRSSSTVRKYIFYVGNSLPGGADDTYSGADETAFLQAVLDGQNNSDITTSVIELQGLNLSQPAAADQAEIDRIHALAANNGQGRYVKHSALVPVLATFLLILDSLCYVDEGFAGDGYEVSSHLLCCRTRVCKICLEFEEYGEEIEYGYAEWDDSEGAYIGTVAGGSFKGYWAVRDSCYFFVEIDDTIQAAFPQCPDYGEEGTGCRSPGGSFTATITSGYSEKGGTLTFSTLEPKRLRRIPGVIPGQCLADVAIVLDTNWRNTPGVEDLQGTELQPMIDYLDANFDSYRLALIKFSAGISSHTLVTDFSLNNGSTFLSDLNAITPSGGSMISEDNHRRSDGAIAIAVNNLTWRSGAKKKIILLNQGRPGDATPVADDNSYELAQLNVAGSAPTSGISVDCLSLPYVNSGYGFSFSYGGGVQSVNLETANVGSGAHVSITALNGASNYNGGTNVLAPAVIDRVETMSCNGDGACASHFCGTSDCTSEKLCITISRSPSGESVFGESCYSEGILNWADTDTCELGTDNPFWEGSVSCGSRSWKVTVWLKKNDYVECVLYGEMVGDDETIGLEETVVANANRIYVTWTIEDLLDGGYDVGELVITINTLECGVCLPPDGGQLECCDFAQIQKNCPTTATLSVCGCSFDLTEEGAGSCDSWSGSGTCSGEVIDVTIRCLPAFNVPPGFGYYELSINCNSLGPNPAFAYANFISCDPFMVVWEVDFTCNAFCSGQSTPLSVVLTGDGGDLTP